MSPFYLEFGSFGGSSFSRLKTVDFMEVSDKGVECKVIHMDILR